MRLFIALPLDPAVENQLGSIIEKLKQQNEPVRWVRSQIIHLTLRFLGETKSSVLPQLKEMLSEIVSRSQPITTAISSLGTFPAGKRARLIWAGFAQQSETLIHLAASIEQGVRKLRFAPETKQFSPHLTLGRVKRNRILDRLPSELANYRMQPIPLLLDRLTLFHSILRPDGPEYTPLWEGLLGQSDLIQG